ncbi:MAG TPA: hypothetical protein VF339_16390 [Gammaproteobacteria bacterium]
MHKALIAQGILSLSSPPDRAETMAGDLVEEARTRGGLWLAGALVGVSAAMFFHAFGAARARTLARLGLGLAVWFAVYVATRVVGALLGLQPLVIDARSVAELPLGTLLYLGGLLMLSNFVTGLVLGRGSAVGGMNPVMPLAMFWASTAVIALCADVSSGTSTWFCTLLYVGGLPTLYIAPLLLGGMLAARTTPSFGLGASR